MDLIYYHEHNNYNFGDVLNPYIFHKLFPEILCSDNNKNVNFYGIGSIIDARIKPENQVIIFGTGIRDITIPYNTQNWDIRFLRGPISSNVLGLNGAKYIADGAYCMLNDESLLPDCSSKKYKFSLMPHYRQMDKLDWKTIGNITGIHIIDPRNDYLKVLVEIAETEKLMTIAMHGAIIADILRIPWLRIKMDAIGSEKPFLSDMKWLDFLLALKLTDYYVQIKNYYVNIQRSSPLYWISYYEIIQSLKHARKNPNFQLSSDIKLNEVKSKLEREINLFRTKYQ